MMIELYAEFNGQHYAIVETQEGVSMKVELTVDSVTNFVKSPGVNFKELKFVCLGLAVVVEAFLTKGYEPEYTQGCEPSGAVVLRDGLPLTIDEVLELLNKRGV